MTARPFAVVTGASTGIGLELARICVQRGYDVLIAADEPEIEAAGDRLRNGSAQIETAMVDLGTPAGVDQLYERIAGRPVDVLLANAGLGLGRCFLDQDFAAVRHVVDTNVTGTIYLVHKVGRDMRARGAGRILIVGSIAGFVPGAYTAVYNATKAFLNSFSHALREELKDTGVTVTCLMPGATDTAYFRRAGLTDTKLGRSRKDSPAEVAEAGFDAMMVGAAGVVPGWKNRFQSAFVHVLPGRLLAGQHSRWVKPGT